MQKIHRYVKYVVDPLFIAEIVVEHAGRHTARAASVSVQAWARVESHLEGRPSLKGELANRAVATGGRAGDRGTSSHVGFVGEIETDLHGAGSEHHVEAKRTDLRHVSAHDQVASFGIKLISSRRAVG